MARVGIDNFYVCEDISSNSHNAGPTQLENNPTEPQVDLHSTPIEDELFMVNNNLLNIPKGDNTMKNVNSQTVSTQVFDINEYKTKVAKLNSLTEYSKDLKARLEENEKHREALKNNLVSLTNEVDSKIESVEQTIALEEIALETSNLEIEQLETLISDIRNIEYSAPSSIGEAAPSIPSIPLIVEEIEETPSLSNSKFEREQATRTFTRKELEDKLDATQARIETIFNKADSIMAEGDFRRASNNLDETLATPEGKAQIIDGLNSLIENEVSLLTYEELVKGNIFSKRTEDGFLPDVIVSTILNRLTKALEVDKSNGMALTKKFKAHHNPVLTKAQKKRFNTFIRSNKVS